MESAIGHPYLAFGHHARHIVAKTVKQGIPRKQPIKHTMFTDIQSAARGLLGEACEIANSTGLNYAVCGGWSPVLRNSGRIKHPGTKDVDLLFEEGVNIGGLRILIKRFHDAKYLPSAKHEFQLLRILNVDGREFVFNVDLLHPKETEKNSDLFVHHLDLPIWEDSHLQIKVGAKSIALPNSAFVFKNAMVSMETIQFPRDNGEVGTVDVPLINEAALLMTKSKSCSNPKRPRDLFDIYLAITQPRDVAKMQDGFYSLQKLYPTGFASLADIRKVVKKEELDDRIAAVFEANNVSAINAIAEIGCFLNKIGIANM